MPEIPCFNLISFDPISMDATDGNTPHKMFPLPPTNVPHRESPIPGGRSTNWTSVVGIAEYSDESISVWAADDIDIE